MTTTRTTKATHPGYQTVGHRTVKGSKRSRTQFNLELQAKLRRIQGLYELDKKHRETYLAEYKREKDSLIAIMQEHRLEQVDLIGTPFYVMKKERADWTYPDELEDRQEDLNADKKKAQRKGTAINEPTEYVSVGHH